MPVVDFTRWVLALGRRNGAAVGPPGKVDGVIIGQKTQDGVAITWPRPIGDAAGHVGIWAGSGSGKTKMMAFALVREFAKDLNKGSRRSPCSMLVVDGKDDLVEAVLQALAHHAPHLLGRVTVLDPFMRDPSLSPFPFNLAFADQPDGPEIFAAGLAETVGVVSTSTGTLRGRGGIGARQQDLLSAFILAAIDNSHPARCIGWALDALESRKARKTLACLTRSRRARALLENGHISDELAASCLARLRATFAANKQLENLLSPRGSCIQWAELLAPGRLALVPLGLPFGGREELTRFFANLIVREAGTHLMQRRSPWNGHTTVLAIDEAQIVAPVLADLGIRILTTGRSRGVSMVYASQGTAALHDASPTLVEMMMANTPAIFAGRLSPSDAERVARCISPPAGVEVSIGAFRTKMATKITNLPDRRFYRLAPGGARDQFRTVDVRLEDWAKAADRHAEEIHKIRLRLAQPVADQRVHLLDVAVDADEPSREPKRTLAPARPPRSEWG